MFGDHLARPGVASSAGALLRTIARSTLDVVLPALCLLCRKPISAAGGLCPSCWGDLTFLGPPQCDRCGLPFPFDQGPLCGECLRRAPAFSRARAVMHYDEHAKRLILRFKNADRIHAAPILATWLARAGAELLPEVDVLVPVPLHWRRLFRRRYNQSALLARALARQSGVPWLPDTLRRVRATPTQGGLGARQRRLNVRGAFAVPPHCRARIAGKRALLIDDVLTTGATLDAAARALRRAGAADVFALALARVSKEG
jgi:ComF family protein